MDNNIKINKMYPIDWVEGKLEILKSEITKIIETSTKSSEKLAQIIIDVIKFNLKNDFEVITKRQLKFNKLGVIGWINGKVFYCKKCDMRYDFAVYYKDYPNKPSCKICNSDMEITDARLRFAVPHPKEGGW